MLVPTMVMGVSASGSAPAGVSTYSSGTITPFADEFETYWKTINGKLYYRIWNGTQGKWVNDWTPYS